MKNFFLISVFFLMSIAYGQKDNKRLPPVLDSTNNVAIII